MGDPAITYVVSRWGAPTQTFVRREAAAVASRGVGVAALSLKRPAGDDRWPVRWMGPGEVGSGLARVALRHPLRGARVLATVVRRSSPRNLVPQLAAAAAGLAWAGSGLACSHLHAHFGWVAATAAWAAACVSGMPYSVVLHAFELHDRRRLDRFTPVPLRAAAQVFTISERDRHLVQQRWGLDPGLLRMGVPAAWLDSGTAGSRDDWLVVCVAALRPKKGHALLLDALAQADERWQAVLVGEGPERPSIENRIADLGLGHRVRLAGQVSEAEVRRWLERAAVVALAAVETPDGDRDGIPVALIEAAACGAAVLATRVGAIPELLTDPRSLCPPADPLALARALDALSDPAVRAEVAAATRRRVAEHFVAERAAEPVARLVQDGPARPGSTVPTGRTA